MEGNEEGCGCLVGYRNLSYKKLFYAGNAMEDSELIKKMMDEKRR